jgi:hypothetical protein
MGMFDYVIGVPTRCRLCPSCGYRLTNWQSKDSVCKLLEVHYTRVDDFYTNCEKCHPFVRYRLKRGFADSSAMLTRPVRGRYAVDYALVLPKSKTSKPESPEDKSQKQPRMPEGPPPNPTEFENNENNCQQLNSGGSTCPKTRTES